MPANRTTADKDRVRSFAVAAIECDRVCILQRFGPKFICVVSTAVAVLCVGHFTVDASENTPQESFWSYGYTEVRPGANMFWYMEPCRHCYHLPVKSKPWILWLQGGPGASGVGYGNMEEIGPYKSPYWATRQWAWSNLADLVFVDNPVGTGFSYVTNSTLYVKNNDEIAADLLTWLKEFLELHPAHKESPMYIFCESYGGKMGLGFSKAILAAQEKGEIEVNLQLLALGDSWVSPLHFVQSWGPLLRAWSLIDDAGLAQLDQLADNTKDALQSGNGTAATLLWGLVEGVVGNLTDNVDWYNMLRHNMGDDDSMLLKQWQDANDLHPDLQRTVRRLLAPLHADPLIDFMNGPFRRHVRGAIPDDVKWGAQSGKVFKHLQEDFMRPVIADFDYLLAKGLPITVYEGQLDLICCTLGFEMWLEESQWPDLKAFQASPRKPFYAQGAPKGATAGFLKTYGNLKLYYIMQAGHMVPIDAPVAAYQMVQTLLYG